MENQKELQKLVLESIGEKVKDLGFRKNIARQSFYRKLPFGKYSLHIAFIPHESDFDVTADVAIRFDALENLISDNDVVAFPTSDEKKNSFSIGSQLGHIIGKGQLRWTISDKSSVEQRANEIVETFVAIGIPFLEKYSDLNLVFLNLARNSEQAKLLNPLPDSRAKNAIALAYLRGSKMDFDLVFERMMSYLSQHPNSDVQSFALFADKLRDRLDPRG